MTLVTAVNADKLGRFSRLHSNVLQKGRHQMACNTYWRVEPQRKGPTVMSNSIRANTLRITELVNAFSTFCSSRNLFCVYCSCFQRDFRCWVLYRGHVL